MAIPRERSGTAGLLASRGQIGSFQLRSFGLRLVGSGTASRPEGPEVVSEVFFYFRVHNFAAGTVSNSEYSSPKRVFIKTRSLSRIAHDQVWSDGVGFG